MRERWLFLVVVGLLVGGLAVGLWVADGDAAPGYALASNLVYRIEIAAVVVGVAYLVLVMLRLGWRGETFTRFTVGPAGAEAPDSFESAAEDLDVLRDDVEMLAEELSSALVSPDVREAAARIAALGHKISGRAAAASRKLRLAAADLRRTQAGRR